MSKAKSELRAKLRIASETLAREAFSGKWDEAAQLKTQPLIQNSVLLKELEARCPGHKNEEYEKTFSCAVRDNR